MCEVETNYNRSYSAPCPLCKEGAECHKSFKYSHLIAINCVSCGKFRSTPTCVCFLTEKPADEFLSHLTRDQFISEAKAKIKKQAQDDESIHLSIFQKTEENHHIFCEDIAKYKPTLTTHS